jgi:hypothetical protein
VRSDRELVRGGGTRVVPACRCALDRSSTRGLTLKLAACPDVMLPEPAPSDAPAAERPSPRAPTRAKAAIAHATGSQRVPGFPVAPFSPMTATIFSDESGVTT